MYTMGSMFNSLERVWPRRIVCDGFGAGAFVPASIARDNCFMSGGSALEGARLRRLPTLFIYFMSRDAKGCYRVQQIGT